MTTQIALLRAVNVGGRGKVGMSDLRQCLGALGFCDVRTILQSGNVVFRTDGPGATKLEALLEAEFLKRLGLRTSVIVRSAAQWEKMVAANPFVKEAGDDPGHLLAMVSKGPVTKQAAASLRSAISAAGGREEARDSGGHLYLYYPDGIGRSRVTTALIQRALGTPVTGRNWNTVLKLLDACNVTS